MNSRLKNISIIVVSLVIGIIIGKHISKEFIESNVNDSIVNTKNTEKKKPLYWVAPMDSEYRRDSPGKSPMGMELVPFYGESNEGDDKLGIKISRVEANNLAIRVANAETKPFVKTIRSVGYIGFNEDQVIHMHSRVEGWVERLKIKAVGDQVKKGELLFELYSPELVNAQKEYLTALASQQTSLIKASGERLKYLGMTRSEVEKLKVKKLISERLKVLAPMDGVITEIKIGEGAFVMPKTAIMTIADLSKVWINADVFQRDINLVKIGQEAQINVEGFAAQKWFGKINYIYPVLNARSRTLKVRIVVNNMQAILKPNMLVNVLLKTTDVETVQIPKEALIRGKINRVIVQTDDSYFLVTAVRPGRESDDMVEIISGLNGDERVVVSSQFLIDSESNLQVALDRLESKENQLDRESGRIKNSEMEQDK